MRKFSPHVEVFAPAQRRLWPELARVPAEFTLFREALDRAPPGVIDPRSWAYWSCNMGRYPTPTMPTRPLGTGEPNQA